MRVLRSMLTSLGLLLMTSATAMAVSLQDPAIKVEVNTSESKTTWYTDPMWLAIGGVVVLLIIVLAVMAGRNKSSTTTVVK
jgi:hypothetical protein